MAKSKRCQTCLGRGWIVGPNEKVVCHDCRARIRLGHKGTEVHVAGTDADEVAQVARQLAIDASTRHEVQALRTPWVSGSFYLLSATTVIVLLLVVGRALPPWTLPVVILGAVFVLATVGALQLRQDDRLSEQGFLTLMGDTLRHLPRTGGRPGGRQPEVAKAEVNQDPAA